LSSVAYQLTFCGFAKAQIALALCGGIWAFAYVLLAAVFFSLISTLENNLKISLKKFAGSK